MTEVKNPGLYDKGDTAILIYVLYLANLFMPVIPFLIGGIWAFIEKDNSTQWLKSHYSFQIHTFWKGLLFLFIGGITTPILIGFLVLAFYIIWMIIRCIKGISLARKKEHIENPKAWFFNLKYKAEPTFE